jgi:2-C-methyl-D-erythritol 2,4-cyclodiphosphate synthase
LVLGGVETPSAKGAVGHSDADVVMHALTDALLGAMALGDIGELFPDTDPAYKGADSRVFVEEALARTKGRGSRLINADIVIELETPKIGPFRERIRENVASVLNIPMDRVSIKAKTNEGVGPIGRGEAVGCQAVILLDDGTESDTGSP